MTTLSVTIDGVSYEVEVQPRQPNSQEVTVTVGGTTLRVRMPNVETPEQLGWFLVDGRPYEVVIDRHMRWIESARGPHTLEIHDLSSTATRPTSGDGRVKAPIPGTITSVLVGSGDRVQAGQPLLVLEAMKMENQIRAARPGTVAHIHVTPGQGVALNAVLVEIE